MELKDQVCTLEQAKRLKELGVDSKSLFYHIDNRIPHVGYEGIKPRANLTVKAIEVGVVKYYAAYTASELGELLGEFVECINKTPSGFWRASHEHPTIDKRERNFGTGTTLYETAHDTEASARAAMLIYLLENKLIGGGGRTPT